MRGATTIGILLVVTLLLACSQAEEPEAQPQAASETTEARAPAHASNVPPLGPTNIVSIAQASEDHETLVAAIVAADYVTAVAASGPLTVFAPTDAAFAALPEGTLDELLKPENADQLREILKYHVTTSALAVESFRDGQVLGMANGEKAVLHVEDGVVRIGDARILDSIRAENGMVHVVDAVLLPPEE